MLGSAAAEIQPQAPVLDRRGEREVEIALGGLEHVLGASRSRRRLLELAQARARAPLRIVDDRPGRLAKRRRSHPVRELDESASADAVGRQLRAQVGPALRGLAHLGDDALERSVVEDLRRDHDALLLEAVAVGRHRPRPAAAHVGVMSAARGETQQAPALEDGRYDGDVGQVRPAGERVVEDVGAPLAVLLAEDCRDGVRHRSEVDGDVLRLHHHLAVGVEERGRGVAALLDVRRVRRADQNRAHLLARRTQRAAQNLEPDRAQWRA